MKFFIGVDNGVTGSCAVIDQDGRVLLFSPTPTFSQLSYTKSVNRHRTRVDYKALRSMLLEVIDKIKVDYNDPHPFMKAVIERPMINPMRFQATVSASASLEATLICMDELDIPYEFIDSRQWQKVLLPAGTKGSDELKNASADVGARMFPSVLNSHKDYDGLLIAEYARRMNL